MVANGVVYCKKWMTGFQSGRESVDGVAATSGKVSTNTGNGISGFDLYLLVHYTLLAPVPKYVLYT